MARTPLISSSSLGSRGPSTSASPAERVANGGADRRVVGVVAAVVEPEHPGAHDLGADPVEVRLRVLVVDARRPLAYDSVLD